MGRVVVAGAVLLVVASIGSRALAVVLCARPRGDGSYSTNVKIREQCRVTETQLDPIALGLQGPSGQPGIPGAAGAPGSPGAPGPGLVVRDANGVLIGVVSDRPMDNRNNYTGSQPEIAVVRSEGGRLFTFEVGADGVRAAYSDIFLYYEGADCTGRMGMAVSGPAGVTTYLIPRAQVVDSSRVFYFWGAPVTLSVVSVKQLPMDASGCASIGGTFAAPDTCCREACAPTPCQIESPLAFETDLSSLVTPFRAEMQ